MAALKSGVSNWLLKPELLDSTPSRICGIDKEKEATYRQQAANCIQEIGQRLRCNQLCINTAIVYMHRFYMHHSFTRFHRNKIALTALYLAAKVEEQPRKLEHMIQVSHMCSSNERGELSRLDPRSELYNDIAQELVLLENVMLQTLGFEVAIEHPHKFVVKGCQLIRASKSMAKTSYFLATNSLHLTTFCLVYKPALVACMCIQLACKWDNWTIPVSQEGKQWYKYIEESVTETEIDAMVKEFLDILDRVPSKLKRKVMSQMNEMNRESGKSEDHSDAPLSAMMAKQFGPGSAPSTSSSSRAGPPGASSSSRHPTHDASRVKTEPGVSHRERPSSHLPPPDGAPPAKRPALPGQAPLPQHGHPSSHHGQPHPHHKLPQHADASRSSKVAAPGAQAPPPPPSGMMLNPMSLHQQPHRSQPHPGHPSSRHGHPPPHPSAHRKPPPPSSQQRQSSSSSSHQRHLQQQLPPGAPHSRHHPVPKPPLPPPPQIKAEPASPEETPPRPKMTTPTPLTSPAPYSLQRQQPPFAAKADSKNGEYNPDVLKRRRSPGPASEDQTVAKRLKVEGRARSPSPVTFIKSETTSPILSPIGFGLPDSDDESTKKKEVVIKKEPLVVGKEELSNGDAEHDAHHRHKSKKPKKEKKKHKEKKHKKEKKKKKKKEKDKVKSLSSEDEDEDGEDGSGSENEGGAAYPGKIKLKIGQMSMGIITPGTSPPNAAQQPLKMILKKPPGASK